MSRKSVDFCRKYIEWMQNRPTRTKLGTRLKLRPLLPTYYKLKNGYWKKTAIDSIRKRLDFENTYVPEFLHVWKTKSKTTQK